MHMFIYMWGIAKIRVSVGQSAHDLFSKLTWPDNADGGVFENRGCTGPCLFSIALC